MGFSITARPSHITALPAVISAPFSAPPTASAAPLACPPIWASCQPTAFIGAPELAISRNRPSRPAAAGAALPSNGARLLVCIASEAAR